MSYAQFGTRWAREVVEARPSDLPAAGELPRQVLDLAPLTGDWSTSLDETAYRLGVRRPGRPRLPSISAGPPLRNR